MSSLTFADGRKSSNARNKKAPDCSGAFVPSLMTYLMRVAFVPVAAFGQLLERVFGRWAGQGPFQRVGVFVPVVVFGDLFTRKQRVEHDAKEEHEGREGQERAIAGDGVPVFKRLGIVDVTAWHTLTAKEMLWEERQV